MATTALEIIPAIVPITVTQGDTLSWTTTITVDGEAADLTTAGNEVSLVVEYLNSEENLEILPDITLGSDGTAVVVVSAADTAAISVGGYTYSLKWTQPDGTIRTLHAGPFTVIKPVS